MNRFPLMVMILVLANACDAKSQVPQTDEEKTFYALGATLGRNLAVFNLSKEELGFVIQGLTDQHNGVKSPIDPNEYQMKIRQLAQKRGSAKTDAEKAKGEAFLAKVASEPGVTKTASGLLYKEDQAGTGETPAATDRVKVNYRGTLIDGTEFDSSAKHGDKPAEFPLNGVVPCWTEGIQKMKVGGKAKLYCPSTLAYRDNAQPNIPGGSTLVFEVELVGVTKPDPNAPAPALPPGGMGGITGRPPFPGHPSMPSAGPQPGAHPTAAPTPAPAPVKSTPTPPASHP